MATVGRRVSARSGGRGPLGQVGPAGAVLTVVAVVGLVLGFVLTRGDDGIGGEASGRAAGQAVGQAGVQAQTDVQPVGQDGLLKPTLQCPGRSVRTVSVKGKDSSKDTPTDIARRWLSGKGDGLAKGVKPSTFRVIVPGGAASTTARQGYLMMLDADQITVALLEIDRAGDGGGWLARKASTCA